MPPDPSTTTHSRIGVQQTPTTVTSEPSTTSAPSAIGPGQSSAGDDKVAKKNIQLGKGIRLNLFSRLQKKTANASTAAPAQSAAETEGENTHAANQANGEAAHTAAQRATTSPGGPPDGAEPPAETAPTAADAQQAAEAQKLQEQIELSRKKSRSALDGLSDSSRDDLLTQLGGNRNWEHEGIRQADKLAEEMAKQSERWGKI